MTTIPLLDPFDTDRKDLISGWEAAELPDLVFPERMVLAILGDAIPLFADKHGMTELFRMETVMKDLIVYRGERDGQEFGIVETPVGAPAAVMTQDMLHHFGTRATIAVGSCGGLQKFDEGTMLIPTRALRDEGTSFAYAEPSRWITPSQKGIEACRAAVAAAGLDPVEVSTWTTDAIYRETPARIAARKAEGCEVVEMECASFAACAQFAGAEFGQILYTGDCLADVEKYDGRGMGRSAREVALGIAVDAALRL